MSVTHYETRAVTALTAYAKNSRVHSPEQIDQIAASIEEWGFTIPVLIDEDDNIIAGHARVAAATQLGLEVVPVLIADGWTEDQKRAYVIADNRLAETSTWNEDLLREEFKALAEAGYHTQLTGFSHDIINDLINTPLPMTGKVDPNTLVPVPEVPFVAVGETWACGPHKLYIGDSLDPEALAALCDGVPVALWLTDPPYNVDYSGSDGKKIVGDKQEDAAFRLFLADAYRAVDPLLIKGGVFYIWYADTEAFNFHGACRDVGWKIRQCLVWKKSNFVLGHQDYHWKHESAIYGNKMGGDPAWYEPEHEQAVYGWKDGAGHNWNSDRKQTTVLEFDKPKSNLETGHPTAKPVELFEYLMRNSTAEGDLVLDSFGGSGTTMIAAAQAARICRVVELDPRYAETILKRWLAFSGQEPILLSTGQTLTEVQSERTS